MKPHETLTHRGCVIEIHQDPESQIEDLASGGEAVLLTWHRRYSFGPPPPSWATDAMHDGQLAEAIEAHCPGAVILPVFLLDHSGLRMSVGSFGCPWDSGQVGVIYAPASMWGEEPDADERIEATKVYLRAVVDEIDCVLSGNVWGYRALSPEGDEVGSCWGYVGDWRATGMVEDAQAEIDHELSRRATGDQLVAEAYAL